MYNLGDLRESIVICRPLYGVNEETGMPQDELIEMYKLRAKRLSVSAREYIDSDRIKRKEVVKFLIHSRRDITMEDIIRSRNMDYNITYIKNDTNILSNSMWKEITCEKVI